MPRILHLDLARGFTVLIMPSVHVVMLYSNLSVQQSFLGDLLRFLAEGPGAQLFMLLMGVSVTLSRQLTGKQVLQRTFYLLVGAFALNLYKLVIPNELELLPPQLLHDLNLNSRADAGIFFLFMGDIFHFAAIGYPVVYLVYRLPHYRYWAALFAIAIMLLSPSIWDVKTEFNFVDRVLSYFNGQPPSVFFPAFPWLVYPLAGLCIGKSVDSKTILPIGSGAIIISLLFPKTIPVIGYPSHYRTMPADTLFHTGLVLVWLSLFRWVSRKFSPNPVFSLLSFCSKHISTIYIIQWLLIFWSLPLAGYLELGLAESLVWIAGVTLVTLTLTKLFQYVPHRKTI